jgi:hypothetical protein
VNDKICDLFVFRVRVAIGWSLRKVVLVLKNFVCEKHHLNFCMRGADPSGPFLLFHIYGGLIGSFSYVSNDRGG